MKSWFGKLIPVIFLCAFFFTTFSIFTIFSNVSTLQESEKSINHTRIVEGAVDDLRSHLLTAENEQRNYLLTGQATFLSNFKTTLERISPDITRLISLVGDNPTEQKSIALLQPLIRQHNNDLQDGIALKDQGDILNFTTIFGNELQTVTQIKSILTAMKTEEESQLALREAEAKKEYQTIYTNSVLTFFGDMLIISIAFYFLRKEFQQRTELEQTKDDFINLASHELNTPITSLIIFTKVLRNKLDTGKAVDSKRYLDKIEEQTNKLTMLITDLLDISRIQTGKISIKKERFPLSSLIQETVEGLQGTTHIHIITITKQYEKNIYADRYRIYQVLVNLLTNAIKYSPKGGRISIASVKKGREVVVSVSDNGIGIDKKYQQKIFERLYQVTEVREKTFPGLGIGLFISHEIINMHGGRMWVESEKGKGSTFFFTIPA